MPDSEIIQYSIQPGDTLWDLAGQYDTTVDDILDFNPDLDPDDLMVGQVIAIPDPQPRRPPFRPPSGPPRRPPFRGPFCPAGRVHVVRPNDTLFRIAVRYGVSVSQIVRRNPHVNFQFGLRPGQSLCVPFR